MVLELTDFSDIKPILHENTTQLKIQASHWFPSSNQREKSIITGPFEKEKKVLKYYTQVIALPLIHNGCVQFLSALYVYNIFFVFLIEYDQNSCFFQKLSILWKTANKSGWLLIRLEILSTTISWKYDVVFQKVFFLKTSCQPLSFSTGILYVDSKKVLSTAESLLRFGWVGLKCAL